MTCRGKNIVKHPHNLMIHSLVLLNCDCEYKIIIRSLNLLNRAYPSCISCLHTKPVEKFFLTDSEQIMAEFSVRLNYSVAETEW